MRLFRKQRERQREAERSKHDAEQDERIDRIQAEVRALSAFVGKQPDLKAVNDR